MPYTEISEIHEFKDITDSDAYSVIKFGAKWCKPCNEYEVIFEGVSDLDDFEGQPIKFYTVNIDRLKIESLKIKSIPVTILFKKGEEIERILSKTYQPLMDMIFRHLPPVPLLPLNVAAAVAAEAAAETDEISDETAKAALEAASFRKRRDAETLYTKPKEKGYYSD